MIADEELYHRVLTGDEGALEALVHRYHQPLLGFLYRQTGDGFLAEDLLQETFARLVSYQGQPPRRFRAWAFTIAANLARDHFRSAASRREGPTLDGIENWQERIQPTGDRGGKVGLAVGPTAGPSVDELLLRDDQRRWVAEAMHKLSPVQREVLVLRFYHDMKLEEIAQVTGSPVGTVKSRLFHALKHMKNHLHPEGGKSHDKTAARSQPGSDR